MGFKSVKKLTFAAAALTLAGLSAPGAAQFTSAKVDFVKAIHARDGTKVMDLLQSNPPGLVDARDEDGNTPLIITIARKDEWAAFLLNKNADPNLPGKGGDTPLIAAARVGYMDALEWLLTAGAKVDAANRMGETPLIVAVQQRQVTAVKRLLAAGANPDKADTAAGLSARDYAARDTRSRQILELIEARKPKAAAR
jgi:ankyrin repeat protein